MVAEDVRETLQNTMTDFDRAFGKLYGKILQAKGNTDIDDAFTWFDTEYKAEEWFQPLDLAQKIGIMTMALGHVELSDKAYRGARKILVQALTGGF